MKNLELNQMERLNAEGCDYQMGLATGLMVIGIASAFTGVGALFLAAGAGLGYYSSESEACANDSGFWD